MITTELYPDGSLHRLTEDGRDEPELSDTDAHPYGRHALPEIHGECPSDVYRIYRRVMKRSFPQGADDYVGHHRAPEVE